MGTFPKNRLRSKRRSEAKAGSGRSLPPCPAAAVKPRPRVVADPLPGDAQRRVSDQRGRAGLRREPRRWERDLCCRGVWAGGRLGPRVPGAPTRRGWAMAGSQAAACPAVPLLPVPRAPKRGLRRGGGRLDPGEITSGYPCGASRLGKPTPIPALPSGELCEAVRVVVLFRSNKTEPLEELLTLKAARVMEINET